MIGEAQLQTADNKGTAENSEAFRMRRTADVQERPMLRRKDKESDRGTTSAKG